MPKRVWLCLAAMWACDDGGGTPATVGDAMLADAAMVDMGDGGAGGDMPDAGPMGDMDPPDGAPPPDGAVGPTPPTLEAPIEVAPEAIFAGALTAFAPLDARTIAVATDAELTLLSAGERETLLEEAVVLNAAVYFDDLPIIAADGLVWVLGEDGLVESPLSDEVPDVVDLAVADGALWLAGSDGLYRWRDGVLREMVPDGLPAVDARIVADDAGLWIGSSGAIYSLTPESAQPTAAVAGAQAPVVDATGVWVLGDGRLWWLDDDLFWWPIELPLDPEQAAAHPAVPGVWLSDGAGLWLLTEGSLFPYAGAPAPDRIVADGEGAVLIAAEDGLWRVASERFVRVEQPPDRVTRPVDVAIRPALPAEVASVTARVGDTPIDVAGSDPWTVTLSPALGEGELVLTVTVAWTDDQEAEVDLPFVAHVVNWAEDVHPISVTYCGQCHGAGGTGRPLHTFEHWTTRIDEVVDATVTGRMPLPSAAPIPDAQVQLIIDWQNAGLPEDRP